MAWQLSKIQTKCECEPFGCVGEVWFSMENTSPKVLMQEDERGVFSEGGHSGWCKGGRKKRRRERVLRKGVLYLYLVFKDWLGCSIKEKITVKSEWKPRVSQEDDCSGQGERMGSMARTETVWVVRRVWVMSVWYIEVREKEIFYWMCENVVRHRS